MQYPESFVRDVILPDGVHVRLRPVQPSDFFPLKVMLDSLCTETRVFRYFYACPDMSFEEIKYMTRIDYSSQMKIVAEVLDFEWVERYGLDIAGLAGYEEVDDGDPCSVTGEVSVVVADAWQGRKLGKYLFAHAIEVAKANGFTRLVGEMFVENYKMRRLMTELGYCVTFHCEENLRHFSIDLNCLEDD
ncbi:MAG: GNAT family N-acetyltransferase [Promethearchaeota archaeon]